MASWDDQDGFELAVWCDKTVVLSTFSALQEGVVTPSSLLDVIALIDALVWFDEVVVDDALDVDWPGAIADAVVKRPFSADELAELMGALIDTWNEQSVEPRCQAFWRRLFADPNFVLFLPKADMALDSSSDPVEFAKSVAAADLTDLLAPGRSDDESRRGELAAFNTARAFSGGLVAAQLGLFHMPAAVRRGLLGSFHVPSQASDLIAIEPLPGDIRFPSAFGRVASVAINNACDIWEAVAAVRREHRPVREALSGAIVDPQRIRPAVARHRLGFDRPELQGGLSLNVAVVSGGLSRVLTPRRVSLVNRLEIAAVTISQAADDLCRVARIDTPVIGAALADLSEVATRLAA